jgi:hypothetical protein
MFVLLARDKHAPIVIAIWASLREAEGESPEKVEEARSCADAMITWAMEHGKFSTVPLETLNYARKRREELLSMPKED